MMKMHFRKIKNTLSLQFFVNQLGSCRWEGEGMDCSKKLLKAQCDEVWLWISFCHLFMHMIYSFSCFKKWLFVIGGKGKTEQRTWGNSQRILDRCRWYPRMHSELISSCIIVVIDTSCYYCYDNPCVMRDEITMLNAISCLVNFD